MLTDLNWIAYGEQFPPLCEKERIKQYDHEQEMFEGEYRKVYGDLFAEKANMLRMKDIDITTVINYPQLLSKKTADFVCGEPPVIDIGEDSDRIGNILSELNFNGLLYQAFIDVSRYGNAILKVLEDRLSIVPPKYWFPVVDRSDRKNIIFHVLAFTSDRSIYVEIHEKGKYTKQVYEIETGRGKETHIVKFGRLIESEEIKTGIDDFAIQVLSNVTTSDKLYGVSDYDAIKGTMAQLLWRIYCVERILDKHTIPSIVGPSSMLEKDPITGIYLFNNGNFFTRDDTSTPEPKYLTWDGNLQSVQWEIEWLTNQLYTLSEMGAAFLEGKGEGAVNSGRALRLRMTSPLIKTQRLVGINERAVQAVICLISVQRGIKLTFSDVALTWNDGLPDDIIEEAELYERATGGKPFMSQYTAVKRFGNFDDAATEEELEQIEAENQDVYQEEVLTSYQGTADIETDNLDDLEEDTEIDDLLNDLEEEINGI